LLSLSTLQCVPGRSLRGSRGARRFPRRPDRGGVRLREPRGASFIWWMKEGDGGDMDDSPARAPASAGGNKMVTLGRGAAAGATLTAGSPRSAPRGLRRGGGGDSDR